MMTFPELMRKYLPLWVALSITLALLIGYNTPGVHALKPAIPFLLFVMLYPMMINLRVEDIGKALKDWKLFSVAILMHTASWRTLDTRPLQPCRPLSRHRLYPQGYRPLQRDGGRRSGHPKDPGPEIRPEEL